MRAFWRCLRGQTCHVKRVFRGQKAYGHWAKQDDKRRRYVVKLKRAELVRTMTDVHWKKRWKAAINTLSAVGFDGRSLGRLGADRSVVSARRNVALALTRTTIAARGRSQTSVLFVVLWRVRWRWYVASWECAPKYVVRFLTKHPKPS